MKTTHRQQRRSLATTGPTSRDLRLDQRGIFERDKRFTQTTDADWNVSLANTVERYKESTHSLKSGNAEGRMRIEHNHMFFLGSGGDHEDSRGLHNEIFELPKEELEHLRCDCDSDVQEW
jgi:hypothetical protein